MLQPYQHRVVIERAELEMKIDALGQFITEQFYTPTVSANDLELMEKQFQAMRDYSACLAMRIAKWEQKP